VNTKWTSEYDEIIKKSLQKDGGFDTEKMAKSLNLSKRTVSTHTKRIAKELNLKIEGVHSSYVRVVNRKDKSKDKSVKKPKITLPKKSILPGYKKWVCKCKCKEDEEIVFLIAVSVNESDAKKFIELNYNVNVIEVLAYEEHVKRRNNKLK
jgi:DNA-binding Lrp family transcriptional regulator